jgi:hypothetical protein
VTNPLSTWNSLKLSHSPPLQNQLSLLKLNWYRWGGELQMGPFGTVATNRPIVPALGDYDGDIGGMIGRGNRSTRKKPAPMPLCPPQAARTQTWATMVGSQQLTAWATGWPRGLLLSCSLMDLKTSPLGSILMQTNSAPTITPVQVRCTRISRSPNLQVF